MNFADSLRNAEEDVKRKTEDGKKQAIQYAVDTAKKAVMQSAAAASQKGLHKVSGYVVEEHRYDADTLYYLAPKWGYDDPKLQNVNILQIDRLNDSLHLMVRYPHWRVNSDTIERHRACIKLSDKEVKQICLSVEKAIQELGFSSYSVEAAPMHFYYWLEETRNGIFGRRNISQKMNDGIGRVLKIEVRW